MNLARWKELEERATPGPWYLLESPWLPKNCDTMMLSGSPDPHAGRFVCDFDNFAATEDDEKNPNSWEDAELLCLLRNLSPALLRVVEAAEKHFCGYKIGHPLVTEPCELCNALAELRRLAGEGE